MTAQEYNVRLGYCGCCQIPLCPAPAKVSQSFSVQYGAGAQDFYEETAYLTITRDASWTLDGVPDSGSVTLSVRGWGVTDEPCGGYDPDEDGRTVTTTGIPSGATGITYGTKTGGSGVFDPLGQLATAEANYPYTFADVPPECYGITTYSRRFRAIGTLTASNDMIFARFRFRIPDTHLGSYFKITYDIADFPDTGSPSFVTQDNVVEWTGPGTGESTDPSWLTPWVEIDPPVTPGERRVVNIRYVCRHGVVFPALPQLTGEVLEIP